MPKIVIKNLESKTIHYADKRENLLQILLSETDWMHACGAKGRCTTCKGKILDGIAHFEPLTANEIRFKNAGKLADDERLMCQAVFSGEEVTVQVPDTSKLPHLTYSN